MRRILLAFLFTVLSTSAWATLQTKTIDYSYQGKTFKGYLAWDDAITGKRPGVLVVHEFWGLNDYAKMRADQLAKLGYVAFAADMYGDGKVGKHPDEAAAMMAEVRGNLANWLGRANAARQVLRDQPNVDSKKIAAIGYCFGGATVLQLAFSGADIAAVASFHGALPVPETAKNTKAKILILHGGKDTFVTMETVQQLKSRLDQDKVDYKLVVYPEVVHSFTVKDSEKRGMPGVAYNAEADRQSWQEMLNLFQQVFGKGA